MVDVWFHVYCEKAIGEGRGRREETRGEANIKASMHRERSVALMGISFILYIQLFKLMLSMHHKCLCSSFLPPLSLFSSLRNAALQNDSVVGCR